MALVKCPECGNQVSTAAASCPKCGAPIASPGIHTPLATVQRTSKPLKAQGCLSTVVIFIGLAVLGAGSPSGNRSGQAEAGGVGVVLILSNSRSNALAPVAN